MRLIAALLCLFAVAACTSLPNPNLSSFSKTHDEAVKWLDKSAAKAGRPWSRLDRVDVAFSGQWTRIVQQLQPDLVNAGFRHSSQEVYFPRSGRVEQTHTGPQGVKNVVRTPRTIDVRFNGSRSGSETEKDAAALVADAYTMFAFGADYLLARGRDWHLSPATEHHEIDGDPCSLVFGTMKPGVGRSTEDKVIAWISQRDHRLRRVQFTLNGLASTAGADVDVTFSDFADGPRGTEWPRHYLETVRRPFTVKAHEWRMTALTVNGLQTGRR